MLHFTQIARQHDALALAADTESSTASDPNIEKNKVAAKNLLRRIATTTSGSANNVNAYGNNSNSNPLIPPGGGVGAPPVCVSVEAGSYTYHVLIEGGVMFLTLCDASSAAGHAYAYLADVSREFLQQYSNNIESYTRPYACIKFDSYLQKTKKVFASHARSNGMNAFPSSGRYPAPVKRLYREVMGLADPNGGGANNRNSGGASASSAAKGGKVNDNTLIVVGGGVAVGVVLLVLLILYFVV